MRYILTLTTAILLSSCSSVNYDSITDPNIALSTIVTKNGINVLTAGAVEATVYQYMKNNPDSIDTFVSIQEILVSTSTQKVLSPSELKELIKNYLEKEKCKYRSYALNALGFTFSSYEETYKNGDFSVEKYNNLIDAIILGINDSIELTEATR